jgi:HSP20 family protein
MTQGQEQRGLARGRENARLARGGAAPSAIHFLRRVTDDIDRLFSGFGLGGLAQPFRLLEPDIHGLMSSWSPDIEVFRRDGRLVVRADVPGLDKDDLQVTITDDNELCIQGERRREEREERQGFYHSERVYGWFCRTLPLPPGVKPESVRATYDNGVLEIEMAAPESPEGGRRVEIREGPVH